jgi:thiosulfate/3-mercaptopyruvate sulfurtransferase
MIPGALAPENGVTASTDWLEDHLGAPDLRVVDIRGVVRPPGQHPRYAAKRGDYDEAHIPGAAFVDWTRDIVDLADPVPVQIAGAQAFAAAMGAIGVCDETTVIAYDDHDHVFAGRLAWALRYYGHDAVRVLDGGWARWVAEGRPSESGGQGPAKGLQRASAPFTPKARPWLRRTADDVMRSLGSRELILIDARPPEQYTGLASAANRNGHIPSAHNVPYKTLVDGATGKFLPRGELAQAFAKAGLDVSNLPREIIVYCNGGVSCTVPLHALRMLGRDDVAVYDGSWNEWGNDPSRPIKTGSEP